VSERPQSQHHKPIVGATRRDPPPRGNDGRRPQDGPSVFPGARGASRLRPRCRAPLPGRLSTGRKAVIVVRFKVQCRSDKTRELAAAMNDVVQAARGLPGVIHSTSHATSPTRPRSSPPRCSRTEPAGTRRGAPRGCKSHRADAVGGFGRGARMDDLRRRVIRVADDVTRPSNERQRSALAAPFRRLRHSAGGCYRPATLLVSLGERSSRRHDPKRPLVRNRRHVPTSASLSCLTPGTGLSPPAARHLQGAGGRSGQTDL
jgi:hypothetical protein